MSTEMTVPEEFNPEVCTPSQIEAIERANVDVQISTAHKFPRSMEKFKARATDMVTIDPQTAESCLYCRPVGKDKNGNVTYAEGLSIRMAEIVGACYGNLRVGAMLIEQTDRHVKARGMAHDLESNFAASSEVIESTVDRNGRPYSERMRIVVAKSALAKARRDATFQVVPKALCKSMEEAAKKVALGEGKSLEVRRSAVMEWVNGLEVSEDRVWKALAIEGINDVGLKEMKILAGLKTAISEGMTPEEAFPAADIAAPQPKKKGGGPKGSPNKPKPKQEQDEIPLDGIYEEAISLTMSATAEEVQAATETAGIDPAEDLTMIDGDRLAEYLKALKG